jgi:hypothetical protein
MMIDFKEIWDSLNNESNTEESLKFAVREINTSSKYKLFLGSNYNSSTRYLFVLLENEKHDISFPRFQGMDITIVNTSIGFYKNRNFICLKQNIRGLENVFELVITAICKAIISLSEEADLIICLENELNEWKLFFDKYKSNLMSLEKQKGLFGELYFIQNYLIKKYNTDDIIQIWKGPEGSHHDFEFNRTAIEIKTTSNKEHKKFTISSEKQLDNLGLDHLYLCLFSLNVHENDIGISLLELANQLVEKMNTVDRFNFEIKLLKAGLNLNDTIENSYRFTVADNQFFEIRNSFPRITNTGIPSGVGDLKYSVMVSACASYKVDYNNLKNIQI